MPDLRAAVIVTGDLDTAVLVSAGIVTAGGGGAGVWPVSFALSRIVRNGFDAVNLDDLRTTARVADTAQPLRVGRSEKLGVSSHAA